MFSKCYNSSCNYYYYNKRHGFLLLIHHPVIRLDYDRRGALRLISFYCCNCLECLYDVFNGSLGLCLWFNIGNKLT